MADSLTVFVIKLRKWCMNLSEQTFKKKFYAEGLVSDYVNCGPLKIKYSNAEDNNLLLTV